MITLGRKEKNGAKLRTGLYIEYDPQASIFDRNCLKIKKLDVLFYLMLSVIRKSIAFWKF